MNMKKIQSFLLWPIRWILRNKVNEYRRKLKEIEYRQFHYNQKPRRRGMTETMFRMQALDFILHAKYKKFVNRWGM